MPRTVVLETFQTYHAFFRAVNQAPRGRRGAQGSIRMKTESKRATCRSSRPRYLNQRGFRATRHQSVQSRKRSCTGGFAIPLTCQETLFLTSSPVAGAAFHEALRLRCRLLLRDSKPIPHPQATIMPLADCSFITNWGPMRKP